MNALTQYVAGGGMDWVLGRWVSVLHALTPQAPPSHVSLFKYNSRPGIEHFICLVYRGGASYAAGKLPSPSRSTLTKKQTTRRFTSSQSPPPTPPPPKQSKPPRQDAGSP